MDNWWCPCSLDLTVISTGNHGLASQSQGSLSPFSWTLESHTCYWRSVGDLPLLISLLSGLGDSLTYLIRPHHYIHGYSSHSFIFGCANLPCTMNGKRFFFKPKWELLFQLFPPFSWPQAHHMLLSSSSPLTLLVPRYHFLWQPLRWTPNFVTLKTITPLSSNYRILLGTLLKLSTHSHSRAFGNLSLSSLTF